MRWDERHWSEKPLEEMAERFSVAAAVVSTAVLQQAAFSFFRDWRIFREDYNISNKGGQLPSPIRYWHEAPISTELKAVIKDLGYEVSTAPGRVRGRRLSVAWQPG